MAKRTSRVAWTMLAGVALSAASFTPVVAAEGCGPGWWRGPWGHCRDTPYTGNTPGGGYATDAGRPFIYGGGGTVGSIGCPPGYWRGPRNECRNGRTGVSPPTDSAGK